MPLPRAASAAPAPNFSDLFLLAPDNLICPAQAIFDLDTTLAELTEALHQSTDPMEQRRSAVQVIGAAQKQGREAIKAAFLAQPFAARAVTRSYAWLTDRLIEAALAAAKLLSKTDGANLTLIAVGGYGRAEMAPSSDVDLLFLTQDNAANERLVEQMLYILWDLRLKVGHATRSQAECLRLAREDFTIRTSLVEARFLLGDVAAFQALRTALWTTLFSRTAPEFIEAKLAERAERHRKQGGQRYLVEPNVKEGKGGLRDLQSLYWIGKYVYNVQDAAALVERGIFRDEEYMDFARAEEFLWAVRCHLHLIAGRATDQLTFDLQVEVAAAMGYTDRSGRRAVEHFMQDYFRQATSVGELTRIFLTAQEDAHLKPAPALTRFFTRQKTPPAPYKMQNNRLTIEDEAAFLADKLNLLRIFEERMRTGATIHPDALRIIKANLHLIDTEMRESREANRIFVDLMIKYGNPERSLRRMNEIGVLAAFIPEFAPIVAMMQFNMYHHYTVDEHTIQAISNLARIDKGDLENELPIVTSILKGANRKVLYIALLLHDIGKGREEDHSILGAQIARRVAPRFGLTAKEVETVEWLIRYHLLMSDTAQKRDISEPRTVRDFAKAVETRERLDLLTVLTVCDIRGVGPDTWNNWKAMLLRRLHAITAEALENGPESLTRHGRDDEAKKALREALGHWSASELKAEMGRHYAPYWQGLSTSAHVTFAELLREIPDNEVRIALAPDPQRDATRAFFAMADHPGLFARFTGALALVGANVVDARTYTSKDGYATATFWIQDADGHPYEASRLPRLRQMIDKTLKGEVVPRDAMKERDKLKKRERAFRVTTSITFDNEGSDIYTIIEVDTRDRPGLLHDLTRVLAAQNVNIASAVIATYGEQVVDTFYVKDMFGLKFHATDRQQHLERKLREAITLGAERALS